MIKENKKSSLATKLTVKEIENIIVSNPKFFNIRNDIAIPNVSWSLLDYEADLLIVNKTGYVSEFEIKRSFEDLKHDFKKNKYHSSELIYKFYYVLPKSIEEKAMKLFEEHQNDEKYVSIFGRSTENIKRIPAVIWYEDNGKLTENKEPPHMFGKHRKLFLEEKLNLSRLISIRYWNSRLKDKEENMNKLDF